MFRFKGTVWQDFAFLCELMFCFKGTVSQDFLLQVFFMNHLPPSLWKSANLWTYKIFCGPSACVAIAYPIFFAICGFAICSANYWDMRVRKFLLIDSQIANPQITRPTQGLGRNWFIKKTWSWKSHGTVPLNFLLQVQNCTNWKLQIHAVIPCQLETIFHSMTEYEWISELFIDHWVPPC